ncbi:hypothetical protein [uncultured Hymenobacter sp.]|uniref:hypothetical protein n=1 Tax=uncultured Hymenobacter sp. TaxID=170016 RepID=UPI0035CC3421
MKLNHSGFQTLSAAQQDQYVHEHGQFLAHRWHENYSIELYALGSFYCERWLEQECLEPERLRILPVGACLEHYPSYQFVSLY